MKILVLNSGSSSVKYQLLEMDGEQLIAKGLIQRIGSERSSLTHQVTGKHDQKVQKHILDHTHAIHTMMDVLTDAEQGVVKDAREIVAVGHRVVHGGERGQADASDAAVGGW